MMPSFTDFVPSHWPVGDWPTTAPNTTQTLEHAQAVSPLYLAALSGVVFIIWCSLAAIDRSKVGRISTKRLLVLIGMAVAVVSLGLLSGENGVSPWIDVAIVIVATGVLYSLAVAAFTAMPIAALCALSLIVRRLWTSDLRKANNERRSEVASALSKGEQS